MAEDFLIFLLPGLFYSELTWASGLHPVLAFVAICIIGSATYIMNDLANFGAGIGVALCSS